MHTSSTGPCCVCEGSPARVIVYLPFRAPEGFRGWGCVQCGLEMRGAVALICDACADEYEALGEALPLKTMCAGVYVMEQKRVPITPEAQRVPHVHDLRYHPEVTP